MHISLCIHYHDYRAKSKINGRSHALLAVSTVKGGQGFHLLFLKFSGVGGGGGARDSNLKLGGQWCLW